MPRRATQDLDQHPYLQGIVLPIKCRVEEEDSTDPKQCKPMDNRALAPPSGEAPSGSHNNSAALDTNVINSSTASAALTGSASSSESSESPPFSTSTPAAEPTCNESLSVQTQEQGRISVDQKPTSKAGMPGWATGDPFFDTMAGMDSQEYRQYLDGLPRDQYEQQEATATCSTCPDQEPMAASTLSTSPDANIGLDHWNRTREQWTMGRWHVVPSPNSNNPALNAIHPGNHGAIYRSLINDRKRLSKPIPLPLVVGTHCCSMIILNHHLASSNCYFLSRCMIDQSTRQWLETGWGLARESSTATTTTSTGISPYIRTLVYTITRHQRLCSRIFVNTFATHPEEAIGTCDALLKLGRRTPGQVREREAGYFIDNVERQGFSSPG